MHASPELLRHEVVTAVSGDRVSPAFLAGEHYETALVKLRRSPTGVLTWGFDHTASAGTGGTRVILDTAKGVSDS